MPDWKDFAVVLCALLVVVGAGALATAAQTFTIVRGKVLEKGVETLDFGNGVPYSTQTISIFLENDDRVFRIESRTVVKYAVSDGDAPLINIGSQVELFISSHNNVARVIALEGVNPH